MSDCETIRPMLGALLDGELDAAHALRCEQHLATCAACAEAFAELGALRARVRDADPSYRAPPGLAARIAHSLDSAEARRSFISRLRPSWPAWSLGGGMAALVASLFVLLMVPRGPDLSAELVASHVRSLQAAHLVDVPTSDRHVVKPWFAGRVDFSPAVVDTTASGFTLVGGRLDYVGGRPVAAIVYRRRLHVINLFVWPADGAASGPDAESREGYNLLRWRQGAMVYWAVSDLNEDELRQFETLVEAGAGG